MSINNFLIEISNEMKTRKAGVAFIAISIILVVILLNSKNGIVVPPNNTNATELNRAEMVFELSSLDLEATGVYVICPDNGDVLLAKNQDLPLPIASLTKLITVYVASRVLDDSHQIDISSRAIEEVGAGNLTTGDRMSFKELASYTLVTSSNQGAYAIAEEVGRIINPTSDNTISTFVEYANKTMIELGFETINIKTVNGLDTLDKLPGAFASAKDMSNFVAYMLGERPDILELSRDSKISIDLKNRVINGNNTNDYLGSFAGHIASKTGYTKIAGGALVLVMNVGLNQPYIITVLGSSEEGRFNDSYSIYDTIMLSSSPKNAILESK